MAFPVTTERALELTLPAEADRFLLVNRGSTLYYGHTSSVSSTNKTGELADGGSVELSSPTWVLSAGHSVVETVELTETLVGGHGQKIRESDLPSSVVTNSPFGLTGRLAEKAAGGVGDVQFPGAVLCLRYDDANAADHSLTKPELDSRGLIGCFAIPTKHPGEAEYMTWEQIKELQDQGHEITAHSVNHGDPTTDGGFSNFEAELVNSQAALLEHNIRALTFVQPGTWTGDYNFTEASQIDGTAAGRVFAAYYANFEAYLSDDACTDTIRQFPVIRRYGGNHVTFSDGGTSLSRMKQIVEEAIQRKGYLQVLNHSGEIGLAGKLSVSDYQAWLDFVKEKRDAGLLHIATSLTATYARRGPVIELLGDPSFDRCITGNYSASDWLANGSPTIQPGLGKHGGNALDATSSKYLIADLAQPGPTTLQLQGWVRNAESAGTTSARIIMRQVNSAGTTVAERDLTISEVGTTYQHFRYFTRMDARATRIVVDLMAASEKTPRYSDISITKV